MTLKISNLKSILELLESKQGNNVFSLDYRTVLRILKVNRIPLLMVKDNGNWLFHLSDFRKELGREKAEREKARDEYASLRERFLNEGIENILFKSTGLPPSFPYTSDNLDVLIKSNYEDKARKILQELGYIELKNVEEPRKFLFRKFRGGESVSAIHLHTQIGWGVPFLDNSFVWNGNYRVSDDDPIVIIPSPEVGLLVTLAHSFYKDKEVNLLNLLRFHELLEENINWESATAQAEERGWLDGFLFSLSVFSHLEEELFKKKGVPDSVTNRAFEGVSVFMLAFFKRLRDHDTIPMPFKISGLFSKALYYKKIIKDKKRDNLKKLHDIISTLLWGVELKLRTKLGIYLQPSMLLAFSGVDGSGKTTQINSLLEVLNICELKAKYIWWRYGCSGFAAFFIKTGKFLFSKKDTQSTSDKGSKIHEREFYLQNRLIRLLWSWLILAELTLKYNVEVRLPLLLGKITICDRYILDAVAELTSDYDSDTFSRVYGKLLRFLTPSPKHAIVLDTSPQAIIDRNHENISREHLKKQILLYRQMAKEYKVTLVNANQPFQQINDNLVNEILTDYYANFRTFKRGLLLVNPNQLNPERKQ